MNSNIIFKQWAPDQPDLGGETLITAKNVLPLDSGYGPFHGLGAGGITVGAANGSYFAAGYTKGASVVYLSDGTNLNVSPLGNTAITSRGSATAGTGKEVFAQYDNIVIATSDGHFPLAHTLGSTSNFATLASSGTAPPANVIGVVGQFIVLGDLGLKNVTSNAQANAIQWSGIDNPRSWPTPNSATAIAQQSGLQELRSDLGAVRAIHGGDQHAIILQDGGVTRMTYVGPPVVFQFDQIDAQKGVAFPYGSVQVGNTVYFVSHSGFFKTDGVNVVPIGAGKVDKFFWNDVATSNSISNALNTSYDPLNNLIHFAYPSSSASGFTCDRMLSMNVLTEQWTYSESASMELLSPSSQLRRVDTTMMGISTAGILVDFNATAGSAIFETSDAELNPGGRSFFDGFAPHVESSSTAPAMTTRIGYRDDLGTTPTYTAATSMNSATGFANFRVDAKYHRAELTITGEFERATGAVVSFKPSGKR